MAKHTNIGVMHFGQAKGATSVAPAAEKPVSGGYETINHLPAIRPRASQRVFSGGFRAWGANQGDPHSYRLADDPPLMTGPASTFRRDYDADFRELAEHERMVRLAEALAGRREQGEPLWPPDQIRRTTSGFAGWLPV
jgi:hypothetical protein